MLAAANTMTNTQPEGSPRPGWQNLLPDVTQRVWRRESSSGVELRMDPPPRTIGRVAADILARAVVPGIGIGIVAYFMGASLWMLASISFMYSVLVALGVIVIGGLVRAFRADTSFGRVQLSEHLVSIDIPTAPGWRRSFSTVPDDIRAVEVRPVPWYRGNQPFERLFGINQREVHIVRGDGTRFIVSPMAPETAELLAALLLAQTA